MTSIHDNENSNFITMNKQIILAHNALQVFRFRSPTDISLDHPVLYHSPNTKAFIESFLFQCGRLLCTAFTTANATDILFTSVRAAWTAIAYDCEFDALKFPAGFGEHAYPTLNDRLVWLSAHPNRVIRLLATSRDMIIHAENLNPFLLDTIISELVTIIAAHDIACAMIPDTTTINEHELTRKRISAQLTV